MEEILEGISKLGKDKRQLRIASKYLSRAKLMPHEFGIFLWWDNWLMSQWGKNIPYFDISKTFVMISHSTFLQVHEMWAGKVD